MLHRLRTIMFRLRTSSGETVKRLRGNALQHWQYKFFRCPGCRSKLRIARGKGKLHITCPRCGQRFKGKT